MQLARVQLSNVVKNFGDVTAVADANLDFEEGSFTTLLGPSGCGKTTILRMIAGLEIPTSGDISIGGNRVNEVPIHKRNIGLVFQNYALFPHKSIGDNIAFGLKYRGVDKAVAQSKVREALELVRLPGVEERYPAQLSGGQQQRIALARAIVIEPDVLLLDEPLSALDANLREEMRVELKAIQQRIGVTTVFVTHDQSEALAMSDRIIVMSAGRVEQQGRPEDVYNTPATLFVANFLGAANILDANVTKTNTDNVWLDIPSFGSITVPRAQADRIADAGPAKLVARAEKISLRQPGDTHGDGAIAPGVVTTVDYQGQVARYFVNVGELELQVIDMIDGRPFEAGTPVSVHLRSHECAALPLEV